MWPIRSRTSDPVTRALTTVVVGVAALFATGCTRATTDGLGRSAEAPVDDGQKQNKVDFEATTPVTHRGTRDDAAQAVDVATAEQAVELTGTELYATHCAACHGERGDGKGVAAVYLFPKPRDFRRGRFRLVSTANSCPTAEDLDAVLVRGMPGSSMPAWAHLSKRDRQALAEEVMRLWREGIREEFVKMLKEEEEYTDDEIAEEDIQEEIKELVQSRTIPGEATKVPEFSEPDADSIARGRETYLKLSCHSCHGKEGRGDSSQKMFDEEGYATSARDYTAGIFKGGHDPASLYRRVAYGMPGTPMPSTPKEFASPKQLANLVHFLRSLSDEKTRQAAIVNRQRIVSRRLSELPDGPDAAGWSEATTVRLVMTPLWWRDGADPDLRIQSVHDGHTIAFRLSWRDVTPDRHAARSESFEDAIALELYRGKTEPFLGMGSTKSPVDVWFWDADRQGRPTTVEQLYPNSVVDVYPFSERAVTGPELDREGARTAEQPDISLPARASGNLIVPTDDASGASSLTVGGPGSVTFRIPKNQLVQARGQWHEGEWTVVMTRTLAAEENGGGVALKPGGRGSIAFAVWDGSHQDRDGKKQITIWQDLELEP